MRRFAKGQPRQGKAAGEMNRTEAAYAQRLMICKSEGSILDYAYEPITLKLANDLRYTPDFLVLDNECVVHFHEVKAGMKKKVNGVWSGHYAPIVEDDARCKIIMAAHQWPMFRFSMHWSCGAARGLWESREIEP